MVTGLSPHLSRLASFWLTTRAQDARNDMAFVYGPVQGFSYSIMYVLEGDEVFIIAVSHYRRRPGYWRSRLR
jgi:hypothetical protein